MWLIRPLFVYTRPFYITIQIQTLKSCCAWDSNPGSQDGSLRLIHCARAAALRSKRFKFLQLYKLIEYTKALREIKYHSIYQL